MILMQVDPLAAADKIPKSRDELLVWGCGIFILLMVGIIVTGGKFILSQVTKLQDETFAMAEKFSNEIQKSRTEFLAEQEKGRVFHAQQMRVVVNVCPFMPQRINHLEPVVFLNQDSVCLYFEMLLACSVAFVWMSLACPHANIPSGWNRKVF